MRLLGPLVSDLAEWRLASRRPVSDVLVFPGRDGDPWARDDWANSRNRVFGPATAAVLSVAWETGSDPKSWALGTVVEILCW